MDWQSATLLAVVAAVLIAIAYFWGLLGFFCFLGGMIFGGFVFCYIDDEIMGLRW